MVSLSNRPSYENFGGSRYICSGKLGVAAPLVANITLDGRGRIP